MTRSRMMDSTLSHGATIIWRITGCTEWVKKYLRLVLSGIAFITWMTCCKQKLAVWPKKTWFREKNHLKMAYFGGQKSGLRDFGRSWRPNCWQHINFQLSLKFWGITLQMGYVEGRLEICRNCCDQLSCRIFVSCVNAYGWLVVVPVSKL